MTSKKTSRKSPDGLGDERPRSGKWTKEEEAYVDLLIEEFRSGALPLREGTTLRSFLSKMVNCNPKRVSKKYENTNYNGKHKYEPSTIPMSMAQMKRRRDRLQESERRFLRALERVSDDTDLEEPEMEAHDNEAAMAGPDAKIEASTLTVPEKQDQALAAMLQQQQRLAGSLVDGYQAAGSKRNSLVDGYQVAGSKRPSLVDGFQGVGSKRSSFIDGYQGAGSKRPSLADGMQGAGSKRPSLMDGYQDLLSRDIHSRMDLANHLSGTGAGATGPDMRDLSLSNTANMSLTLPSSAFASPNPTNKPQVGGGTGSTLHHLAHYDFLSALNKQSAQAVAANGSMCGMQGQLDKMRHSDLAEDPLMRQVRIQQQAAVEQRAQRLLLDQSNAEGGIQQQGFPRQPYLGQASQDGALKRAAGDLPFPPNRADLAFPSLPPAEAERRRHLRPSALDHLSPLHIASLQRAGVTQGLPASSRDVLRGQGQHGTNRAPGSNLVSELGMIESLKREHDLLDSSYLRPFKRLR
ncbi:expressed unknown protein [Seminavis robusta]|uniref:Uncharacterized protein n=1 Tax=Seminavis robusta TaxID=568900 RepID=A0A9N8ECN1_9STRA|nr:expressed unknown protein [Seminavis robusta]|eukprot:Sro752_g197150.1 n/a (521) ;mRNA; f:15788-17350